MRKQLTEIGLAKQRAPAAGRKDIYDTIVPALAVRITANGAKSFVVKTRVKGHPNPIRITLGDARGMKLSDARQEASEVLRACRAGVDPRAARIATRDDAAHQHKNTFTLVAEGYIAEHVSKLRSKTHTEAEIRRYLIKPWAKRPIQSITADDVGEVIRTIVDDGKPHMARLVLAHTKRLFRWAAAPGRARIKSNPCAALSAKKDFDIELVPRQVALTKDHVRLIWAAADALDDPFGPYFKMLLLSGQRRGEVAGMAWSELDLEQEQVWNVPAGRMKAKRPHEVPLSASMNTLLKTLEQKRGNGDYVFSTTAGDRPVSGFGKAKTVLDEKIAEIRADERKKAGGEFDEATFPAWRIHDLRRTMRTGLGAIPEIAPDVRELVIAHVPAALVRTYDLHSYRDEKRQALTLWSERLLHIVKPPQPAGANVVDIGKRTPHAKQEAAR